MAELTTIVRSQVNQIAGRKSPAAVQNRQRMAVIVSAAAYTAPAAGDTCGTELYLKQGARIVMPVNVSNAGGNAGSTVSIGIRDAITKAVIDATAVMNAQSIAAAQAAQVNTGTKLINGLAYEVPQDVELFLTFGGAAGLANQAFRFEVNYVSP